MLSEDIRDELFLRMRLYTDLISEGFHRVHCRIERFFVDRIPIILVKVLDSLEKKRISLLNEVEQNKPKRSSMVGIPEPFLIVTFLLVFVAEPG